jgi:hypothetical protein
MELRTGCNMEAHMTDYEREVRELTGEAIREMCIELGTQASHVTAFVCGWILDDGRFASRNGGTGIQQLGLAEYLRTLAAIPVDDIEDDGEPDD